VGVVGVDLPWLSEGVGVLAFNKAVVVRGGDVVCPDIVPAYAWPGGRSRERWRAV